MNPYPGKRPLLPRPLAHVATALLALLIASSACGQSAPPQNASLDSTVQRFTRARLLPKEKQPDVDSLFPYHTDREALVFVNVQISAAGKVTRAEVENGGFYDEIYASSASKVAMILRFEPARRDGVPVESQGTIPIRFAFGGETGKSISPSFNKELMKVQALVEKKDFAGAHFHAQWMLAEKTHRVFEFAVLELTLALTNYRAGSMHRALRAARKVTAHAGMRDEKYQPGGPLPEVSADEFLLTKEPLDAALKLRFVIDTSQGFYLDAVRAQADRQALKLAADNDSFSRDMTRLLAALQNAPQLRGHVRMDEAGSWGHDLWLNRFAIQNLKGGSMDDMYLRCDGNTRQLTYVESSEWAVPPEWGSCSLAFSGTPGTEFDIVEYRDAPKAAESGH